MAQVSASTLQSSLNKLQITQTGKAVPKVKKAEPAESWEDEADEDSTDTETESQSTTPIKPTESADMPGPPPPTPASPSFGTPPFRGLDGNYDNNYGSGASSPLRSGGSGDEKRPEKSTAVASRLIAAGIGQKAPKRTKEQREYDQAMKVQEKKKRDQAKEAEEQKRREKEKALKDVWGD